MKNKKPAPAPAPSPGFWSGTISFSLVAIPVRLVSALGPGRLAFHLLHKKDHSPLQRAMVCPREGKIVPREDIVRGFEVSPGKQIIISDEELASLSPERSRTIEITEFISLAEVDPLYYDAPYYLVPLKGGEKAYALLAAALKKANKAGVAKFVLDEREYPVLIGSREGALAVNTLHYSGEILPGPVKTAAKFAAADKDKIKGHIAKMAADFRPDKYADERKETLLAAINKKIAKKAVVEAPEIAEEEAGEGVEELMASLQESMRRIKKADEEKKRKH